jgi:hypothetical protein
MIFTRGVIVPQASIALIAIEYASSPVDEAEHQSDTSRVALTRWISLSSSTK